MAKTAFVTARIDPVLKKEAEKIFRELGLSISEVITLFYKQIVLHRKIPFDITLATKASRK